VDTEQSGRFLYLNYRKRSVTLDISVPEGAAVLDQLLADADVVVENLGAGAFDAIPFPSEGLPERLTICSISPYGQDGPKASYAASEITAYASGGMMYITGDADREPVKHGLDQAAHLAGVSASSAMIAAVFLMRRTGRGQRIDISEQETVAQTIFPALNLYSHLGGVMKRAPIGATSVVNSAPMRSSDGWVMPSYAGLGQWWESFAGFLGSSELADERFATPDGRRQRAGEIDELVAPLFEARTKADLFHTGQEWGLTMTSVQTPEDIAECPHLEEREFFIEQEHPVAGTVRMPGPIPLTDGVDRESPAPAPLLGQHTEEVMGAIGIGGSELSRLRNAGIV
jgi:crotonobetainyl-CoA:carnitine CoA-transferase CaiB-like acyl-CoA transferase